jgi:hypothetical protein
MFVLVEISISGRACRICSHGVPNLPVKKQRTHARYLGSSYVGAPMLLTVGIRVTSSLCMLERRLSLGSLNTAGRICLHISSVRMHIWNSSVTFPSVESICSLACHVYDGF